MHVYFDAITAASKYDNFLNKLRNWEEEFKNNKLIDSNQKYYDKYFIVKETPKRGKNITYNQKAIDDYNTNAGYLVLLSNDIKDAKEALIIYRQKDMTEKRCDNLKNNIDMKRLRVHSAESMRGRMFIQFLALIFNAYIRNLMLENKIYKYNLLAGMLEELEQLHAITITGHRKAILSEISKSQREIFKVFGIDPETYV